MRKNPLFKPQKRCARKGFAAVIIGGVGLMLLAALGVGIYTGMVAYVHGELHEMALATAGSAARALYDDFDGSTVVLNSGKGLAAGQQTFANMQASSTNLVEFTPQLDLQYLGGEVYEALVFAQVRVPLVAWLGVQNLLIVGRASAIYGQNDLNGKLVDIHPQGGDQYIDIPLDLPVLNGAGPDLYLSTGVSSNPAGYHGVTVQLCVNNGDCRDISDGAHPAHNKGVMIDRGGQKVLYGEFWIDLSRAGQEKGTSIRILDDLVNDRYTGADIGFNTKGERVLELVPHTVDVLELRTMHHAFMCFKDNCSRPAGFVAGSQPYLDSMNP